MQRQISQSVKKEKVPLCENCYMKGYCNRGEGSEECKKHYNHS